MREWTKLNAAAQRFGILLFEDFSMHCLANTVEPLRAANRLGGNSFYHWEFLSLDGSPVTSSSGLTVAAAKPLNASHGDLLVVMPSYRYLDHSSQKVIAALRSAAGRFGKLAGLDTGSWLLAAAGLLDDRKATIHWEEFDRFAESFPGVEAERERFVIDGDRITCGGAHAAFDMILELIGAHLGQALRLEVATLFMSPEAAGPATSMPARSRSVAQALALMQGNLEHPLPIPVLAKRVGRPMKDFERRVTRELGATPAIVYRRMRLIHARKLIMESELSVSEISLRAGYENASAFTRAFRTEFGTTPREMRNGQNKF